MRTSSLVVALGVAAIAVGCLTVQSSDTAVPIAAAPAGPPDTRPPTPASTIDPHADDAFQEQQRLKSDRLAVYEKHLERLDQRRAIAEMLWQCNLRTGGWYQDAWAMLGADFESLRSERAVLTDSELQESVNYEREIHDMTFRSYMGDTRIEPEGCKHIASSPLATNDTFLYASKL